MTPPTLAEVRAWLQVPASAVSDPQLQAALDSEVILQAAQCRIPVDVMAPTSHLTQALYRRVGRVIAARGVPLGAVGADSEYGPSRLSRWDAEIERLEGPARVVVFG